MITREKALELLKTHIKSEATIRHSLASEAVMHDLAEKLGQDTKSWALAGLLHDIDMEQTNADPLRHGIAAADILQKHDVPENVIDAIVHHNEDAENIPPRSTLFQHALAAAETITGLITATALVYPDKKISSVKVKSVTKRMKEKKFAASVKRENILECEKLDISLPEFAELALNAMKRIDHQLGL